MISPNAVVLRRHERRTDRAAEISPTLPVDTVPVIRVIPAENHSVPIVPRPALVRRLQHFECEAANERPSVLTKTYSPKSVFLVLTRSDEARPGVFLDVLPIEIDMPAFPFCCQV